MYFCLPGPELSLSKLKALMYNCIDVLSEFKYSDNSLLTLRGMLTATWVNNPNTLNFQSDCICHIFKCGFTTNTTVSMLTKFMSFICKYFFTSNMELLKVPIHFHKQESGTFSKGGDSGSLIVSASGKFVALLTGEMNKRTDGSDITFATLFEWVWDLVEKFPSANLYFENLAEFLTAA